MRIYTSHLRQDRAPVLVREGFSWAAFVFGVFYFLRHGAWNAAVLNLLAIVLTIAAGSFLGSGAPVIGIVVLQGVLGNDLLRWGLSLHGYVPGPVVAARNEDRALLRLIDERGDLFAGMSGLVGARF
jgi:hypothetical protein